MSQEAVRLASLGLSPLDIAKRLGVSKASVNRWMASGKLTRQSNRRSPRVLPFAVKDGQSPAEWAAAVRSEYDLDATDDQMVSLGETALTLSLDLTLKPQIRMQAMAQFRATVKQLALVARAASYEQPAPDAKPERKGRIRVVSRRPAVDPRRALMTAAAGDADWSPQ